jgi:hypothetical protein
MEKLARGASGLRHLRWAREIYATLAAHVDKTDLGAARRGALEKELARLDARIQALSGAVKAYRDFLERERVRHRGAIRAAMFAAAEVAEAVLEQHPSVGYARSVARDGSQGTVDAAELEVTRLRAMAADLGDERDMKARKRAPDLTEAAARIEAAVDLLYSEAIPRQRGLKASLELAVAELRAHLEETDARIAGVVSEAFAKSLYPALAAGGTRVADEGDEDDDAAARLG